jgi:predicted pyridoxine 5'-phosphate oxidase superfamily flavin-nucleotide-binding protein
MAILTEEMQRVVDQQKLGFMATVCADGSPNLSPKGLTFVLDDEHLVIGDVRSPRTVANLTERPLAEINVVDPIARKGFRFKGSCRVHSAGSEFDRLVAFLRDKGARSPLRAVIVMRVERALPLISPAYDGGATELEVRRQWKRRVDELNRDLE